MSEEAVGGLGGAVRDVTAGDTATAGQDQRDGAGVQVGGCRALPGDGQQGNRDIFTCLTNLKDFL